MEESTFPLPAVAGELSHFVEARLHADTKNIVHQARIKELIDTMARTPAQPTFVVIDPSSGKELGRWTDGAALFQADIKAFTKFLQDMRVKAGKV
jgi:hypothetical protein